MQILKHIKTDKFEFDYLLDTPENYTPENESLPLIIYLHGVGTRVDNPQKMKEGLLPQVFRKKVSSRCVGLFPQCKDGIWNTKIFQLKGLIDYVAEICNIDMERISITGASMGGFGTWEMILSFPNFFSAAVPVCGGAIEWRASEISHLPIWVFHGDKDPTVDFSYSENMVKKLRECGNTEVIFTVCKGVYHNSWINAYEQSDCLNWLLSKKKKIYDVYVGANHDQGGIFKYTLNTENGEMKLCERSISAGPMWFCKHKSTLYTLLRTPCENNFGGIVTYDITDGHLKNQGGIVSTMGKSPCHMFVDNDENVFAANYITGNILKYNRFKNTVETVLHEGHGINKIRQDKAHPHQVLETPDKKYIVVCDLGQDSIFVYTKNLEFISKVNSPSGSGPRHIIFSKNKHTAFCINELSNSVSVYNYDDGFLTFISDYCMLDEKDDSSTAAAIRLSNDEKFLYASIRGKDLIVIFCVDGEKLTYLKSVSCGGKRPRDINITPNGKYLISANEGEKCYEINGNTVLFKVENDGNLTKTNCEFNTPDALAILFI